MNFNKTTILGLFGHISKSYTIPVYQRAYAWEEPQWSVFLNDLLEQQSSDNNYFYGNILLEEVKSSREYEIIDGQQRITTIIIFLRALLNILRKQSIPNNDIIFKEKESIYFKSNGNIKLKVVNYDMPFFENIIIDNGNEVTPSSISQKKIAGAKEYFTKELNKLPSATLIKLLDTIEYANVTEIILQDKRDSALMFELQNNRGKDLTNMEKLKSYFMYQMYVHSSAEETTSNISSLAESFKLIYLEIAEIKKLSEDSVLIYHCNAFLGKGFNYRTIDHIKEVLANSENKVKWMKNFTNGLFNSFVSIKTMQQTDSVSFKNIEHLKSPAFIYPFILRGFAEFGNNSTRIEALYKLLEVVAFRYQIINTRADFNSRINDLLINFKGDIRSLAINFRDTFNNSWYWGDQRLKEVLLDPHIYSNNTLPYVLFQYEDALQRGGYRIANLDILASSIEHISPQTPSSGSPLESGYDVDENKSYSADFLDSKLNCIGNLVLISRSHNSSIGNKPFAEKLKTYKDNPLLKQQLEIATFLDKNNEGEIIYSWKTEQIEKRKNKIVNFCEQRWSFNGIINEF